MHSVVQVVVSFPSPCAVLRLEPAAEPSGLGATAVTARAGRVINASLVIISQTPA